MTRFVGIDPGERWCGYAFLTVEDGEYKARCGVLDVKAMAMNQLINELTPVADVTVTERFRTRGVGHQHMHNPITAQLIGAIRYAAESKGGQWSEVNAADASELQRFPLYPIITRWRKSWPNKGNARWDHALSAWRVLCQYLLTMRDPALADLAEFKPVKFGVDLSGGLNSSLDLHAPAARWSLNVDY